jgi:alpha-N-acetylglucosaminidase
MDRRKFITSAVTAAISGRTSGWSLAHESSTASSQIPMAGDVRPQDIIIVYNTKSSAETVAAQELHKYINRMTGSNPRLLKDEPPEIISSGTGLFLVGRTPAVAKRISSRMIEEPSQKASEAYVVRSLTGQQGTEVLVLGGTGIATLYAVYHYLEKYCSVGFFQDGDHVPKRDRVPANGVEIMATPRFSERMTMNLTLYWYSAPWWDLRDWESYIDWTLKNRFNIVSLWDTPGEDVVWKKVWKKHGVDIPNDSYSGPPYEIFAPIKYGVRPPLSAGWREEQSKLNHQVIRYARSRGMRTLGPAVPGILPPEFIRLHPDAKTFEISWAGLRKQHYLHPASSTYHQLGRAFLEEYNSLYGTDHLYWLENYLECKIYGTPEEKEDVCRTIGKSNFEVVNEVDSQGVGFLSAWSYLFNPDIWTPDLIREHLDGIPEDRVRILDQWAEMVPYYEKTDYFFGRPWHFGVVYSFAGDTNLHGNMAFIEKQFHNVVNDKGAGRCVGFYPNPETIHHNYFYYQFLAKLGWNPSEVDLSSFTHDYAIVRYGESGGPTMQGALEELIASVYGSDDLSQPAYWHRLGAQPYFRFRIADRSAFIPHLRRALEQALRAKRMLKGSPFYLHDLNDIARQYLAELFNYHVRQLDVAVGALDEACFERQAALLERLMDGIETLLSHDDYYWLGPFIRKAESLPGAPADVSERARDILTLWAGVIRDYASRDYYELVRGYYRPRVRVYIQTLRKLLELKQRQLYRTDELDKLYTKIEEKWVKEGFPLAGTHSEPERVIETVEDILNTISSKVGKA